MRIALFVVAMLFAVPAMAQYQPNLGHAFGQAMQNTYNSGSQVPSYSVQPGPNNGAIIVPQYGRSQTCRRSPYGGFDCQ